MMDMRSTISSMEQQVEEPQLTKLECVTPVVDHDKDIKLQLGTMLQSELDKCVPAVLTGQSMSSCQLSPQSDTASAAGCLNFSLYQVHPTPPSSDLDDCLHQVPSSYYSLSPPDLLSPPMSTSDPCMSPGDSMSPHGHSHHSNDMSPHGHSHPAHDMSNPACPWQSQSTSAFPSLTQLPP